jgi:acyl dehydratase
MSAPFEVGTALPAQHYPVRRADLVRYAGASGDFNPIHWNERFATSVGLPDVIAHGMFTMGLAARAITAWLGDPGAVLDFGVRFTRPVVVPDPGETVLDVAGQVAAVDDDAGTATLALTVTVDGQTVLAKARAVVRTDRSGRRPDRLAPELTRTA